VVLAVGAGVLLMDLLALVVLARLVKDMQVARAQLTIIAVVVVVAVAVLAQ
jgi:hypothetical protein